MLSRSESWSFFKQNTACARSQPTLVPDPPVSHARCAEQACSRPARGRWLGALAVLLAVGQTPALAATIPVDGVICTLVNAITAANTNIPTLGCSAGSSGLDTITLPVNSTLTLTTADNTDLLLGATGLPRITSQITIEGNGSTIVRAPGAPNFRLLTVDNGGNLTLVGTTLSGGSAVGLLLLGNGGAVSIAAGGIGNLTNSTISGNTAGLLGGGIFNAGVLNIVASTVASNTALLSGGGVYNFLNATLGIVASTVASNTALLFGGGVFNDLTGTLAGQNCTISGNTASGFTSLGGGLFNFGILNVAHCTITGNTASLGGGGVLNGSVSSGSASTLGLVHSLITGNTATGVLGGTEVLNLLTNVPGIVNADAFNLIGHDGISGVVGFFPGLTDVVPSGGPDTILAPVLSNNGGSTVTHILINTSQTVSQAIDVIPAAQCLLFVDQRGVVRPQDSDGDGVSDCDIGAVELAPPSPPGPPGPPAPPGPPSPPPSASVTCHGLPATIIGTDASETLVGTNGRDIIHGLGGRDVIRGRRGNDVICGGSGNDRLFGQRGRDRIYGESGNDRLNGGPGIDRCVAGSGRNRRIRCERR